MKKVLIIILSIIYPLFHIDSSDLSKLLDDFRGKTFCQLPIVNSISGIDQYCSDVGAGHQGFNAREDLLYYIFGREYIKTTYGCGTTMYDPEGNDHPNAGKHVSLLGDSLTFFGFTNEIWDAYLDNGKYKVINMGSIGATSSAWVEHFDRCVDKKDRIRLPPRSIMMIGGNDFVLFKGILKPLWWSVYFRQNHILNNLEKIVTHHHRGNNGCGDFDAKGKEITKCTDDPSDWGRGRLFVLLGNIPAVSLDPTQIPFQKDMLIRLGLWERPNDDLFDAERTEEEQGISFFKITIQSMAEAYIDIMMMRNIILQPIINIQQCGRLTGCIDKTWESRQMHKLQFRQHAMATKRGIPYVHMYSNFRDLAANDRGCWWCGEKGLWLNDNYGYSNTAFSMNDGIHINHPFGYQRWAGQILPTMRDLKMHTDKREDDYPAPGEENNHGPECDDLCMAIICAATGVCKK